jgi:hypothetical protein
MAGSMQKVAVALAILGQMKQLWCVAMEAEHVEYANVSMKASDITSERMASENVVLQHASIRYT